MDAIGLRTPPQYDRILARSQHIAFSMNSDVLTGSLLRTLAASKPSGALLELGTGCGLGTCWLLEGMDQSSSLVSVDNDPRAHAIAKEELGDDQRLSLVLDDGAHFLARCSRESDLIYADAWPGKYVQLEAALGLLKPGGNVLPGVATSLSWATGVVLCARASRETSDVD